MKKQYDKPQMEVVKIQAMQMLAGSPDAHDEVGGDGQLAPEFDWVEMLRIDGIYEFTECHVV
jgi:hypothetical protein